MVLDLEKQRANHRYNAHRTYVITAAYRNVERGKRWQDTRDDYAIVTASSPYEALYAYLNQRPGMEADVLKNWVYSEDGPQRVFLVRYFERMREQLDTNQAAKLSRIAGVRYIFG